MLLTLVHDRPGLVRDRKCPKGSDFSLAQYVNDRPYAASSFLSVALNKVFGTAMTGRSKERQDLADSAMPFSVHLPVVPCRGGEAILRRLFEPLYRVHECVFGVLALESEPVDPRL